MGVRRTVAGFSAKNHCDRRKYEYVLPLFAFNPNACAKRLCPPNAGRPER